MLDKSLFDQRVIYMACACMGSVSCACILACSVRVGAHSLFRVFEMPSVYVAFVAGRTCMYVSRACRGPLACACVMVCAIYK